MCRLADPEAYRRGLDYFSHGHVESLEDRGETMDAVVRGKKKYIVCSRPTMEFRTIHDLWFRLAAARWEERPGAAASIYLKTRRRRPRCNQ